MLGLLLQCSSSFSRNTLFGDKGRAGIVWGYWSLLPAPIDVQVANEGIWKTHLSLVVTAMVQLCDLRGVTQPFWAGELDTGRRVPSALHARPVGLQLRRPAWLLWARTSPCSRPGPYSALSAVERGSGEGASLAGVLRGRRSLPPRAPCRTSRLSLSPVCMTTVPPSVTKPGT